ncbi:MAG: AsmA-like C-terminal region-containing protein [Acidobacteriaceae bacterium]
MRYSAIERTRLHRIWKWIGIGLAIALLVFVVAFTIALKRAEPILRARVIKTLSTRFDSRVELDQFHVAVLRGFEASGGGLRLYPNGVTMPGPVFALKTFSFHTGWLELLRSPTHVAQVEVTGLHIHLPPKDQRKQLHRDEKGEKDERKREKKGIRIVVDEIISKDAQLILGTDKPGKVPKQFDIRDLRLHSVGKYRAMRFDAVLTNPKPIGDIQSSGHFGPYDTDDPGNSHVDGNYTFTHADLNSIKGIGGMLSSTGRYGGTLDHILVDGTTDTPNFSVDVSRHPVHLRTQFHAIVDGTNGDTYLQPVTAQFAHSSLTARGSVVTVPGKGHHIYLDVAMDQARIEDMLQLGAKTEPPVMRGKARLNTKLELPPGPARVANKLKLAGNFEVLGATFPNPKLQAKVDELSLRSEGLPDKAVRESKHPNTITARSDLRAHFTLSRGRLIVTDLKYQVPGTIINLDGMYTLDGSKFDFFGDVRTKAHLSQMVGGWKSILLKPVDPFFAKNGSGAVIPITITGTHAKPHFGLDLGNTAKKREALRKLQQKESLPR